jgi:acetoacetate decarboxylase
MRCCTNECIREPECWDFGSQTESGVVIPCAYNGEAVNYTRQMYLDDEQPITAGRKIWDLPKRYG